MKNQGNHPSSFWIQALTKFFGGQSAIFSRMKPWAQIYSSECMCYLYVFNKNMPFKIFLINAKDFSAKSHDTTPGLLYSNK